MIPQLRYHLSHARGLTRQTSEDAQWQDMSPPGQSIIQTMPVDLN